MKRVTSATVASLFLLTLSLGLTPRPAFACSCGGVSAPRQRLEQSDAVFTGKVIGINEGKYRDGTDSQGKAVYTQQEIVLFEVSAVWKGLSQSQIIIGAGTGMCGNSFIIGQRYLVYAAGQPDELSADGICGRTTTMDRAVNDDLPELGWGVPPAKQISLTLPGEPLQNAQNEVPFVPYQEPIRFQYIVAAVTVLAMLVMGGFLVYLKKKAQTN